MRGWFTTPCGTSCIHITAQVRGAAEGWVVGRREATCSAVSGKSLARSPSPPSPPRTSARSGPPGGPRRGRPCAARPPGSPPGRTARPLRPWTGTGSRHPTLPGNRAVGGVVPALVHHATWSRRKLDEHSDKRPHRHHSGHGMARQVLLRSSSGPHRRPAERPQSLVTPPSGLKRGTANCGWKSILRKWAVGQEATGSHNGHSAPRRPRTQACPGRLSRATREDALSALMRQGLCRRGCTAAVPARSGSKRASGRRCRLGPTSTARVLLRMARSVRRLMRSTYSSSRLTCRYRSR